jgi:hypothetical protein
MKRYTFRDIVFKPHRLAKGGIQGMVNLPNNVTVSIVGGPQLYGDGVDTFEVAAWYTDSSDWIPLGDGDDVKGYQDRHDIDVILLELKKK